jgi:antitoxin MazE
MSLRTQLVRIGNSQGIRIPKSVIQLIGLLNEVELLVEGDRLVVRNLPPMHRKGWEERFAVLVGAGEEASLGEPEIETWEEQEWTW